MTVSRLHHLYPLNLHHPLRLLCLLSPLRPLGHLHHLGHLHQLHQLHQLHDHGGFYAQSSQPLN